MEKRAKAVTAVAAAVLAAPTAALIFKRIYSRWRASRTNAPMSTREVRAVSLAARRHEAGMDEMPLRKRISSLLRQYAPRTKEES